MQDPSYGVAQPLQNHVHLVSGHRFPMLAALNLEQAFMYLLDAPTIVSKTSPMSWIYVSAPQDGTVWLEWISSRTGENRFSSDGYVWGDPETPYRQDYKGYTIELMVHTLGYKPGQEHHASHARTRYHLIAKNPAVNAASPDPSLWIVHYHQCDPSRMLPAQQIPVNPAMRHIITERRMLESRGRIERRDFMLHDREHWPTINLPVSHVQQPSAYGNPAVSAQQNRYPPMPRYQQQMSSPPAKRARYAGPNAAAGAPDAAPDTSIEDEENIALGDFFDHLTPREISMARYMQHHRWIEEVFSSPYASHQIVPADLGLGLMGELKGLTEGILEAPSIDEINRRAEQAAEPKEAQRFTNLSSEQLEEFNKRVEKHLEEGQAEIEKMKVEHAAEMEEWKKSKGIMQAEKRLRYATWEGHEAAVPAFRLEEVVTDEAAGAGAAAQTVESVIEGVERLLGLKVASRKEADMVQEGGLEKEVDPPKDDTVRDGDDGQGAIPTDAAKTESGNTQILNTNSGDAQSVAATAQASQTQLQGEASQSHSLPGQLGELSSNQAAQDETRDPLGSLGDVDMGDNSLMGDMDLDVDGGLDTDGVDFGDVQDNGSGSFPPPEPSLSTNQVLAATSGTSASTAVTTSGAQQTTASGPPAERSVQTTTETAAPNAATDAAVSSSEALSGGVDNNLFNDDTFADITDMGGEGNDDGLIDFDGGMGMEESAFGDALHGMDASDALNEQSGSGTDVAGQDASTS